MSLAEFVGLFLFVTQQFGVALGVGAETVFLFLLAKNEPPEAVYQGKRITSLALWLIVLSGIFITLADLAAGQGGVIFEPAYIFKWLLIIALIIIAILVRFELFPRKLLASLSGATWYALFLLHTLAPEASWIALLIPYFAWLIVFAGGFLLVTRSKTVGPELRPTPVQTPPRASSEVVVPIVPKVPVTSPLPREIKPLAPTPRFTIFNPPKPSIPVASQTPKVEIPKPPPPAPMSVPKEIRTPILQPMLRPVLPPPQKAIPTPPPPLPTPKPVRAIPSLATIPSVGIGWNNPSAVPIRAGVSLPVPPKESPIEPAVKSPVPPPPPIAPKSPVNPTPVVFESKSPEKVSQPPPKPFAYEGLSHVMVMPRSLKEMKEKKQNTSPDSIS